MKKFYLDTAESNGQCKLLKTTNFTNAGSVDYNQSVGSVVGKAAEKIFDDYVERVKHSKSGVEAIINIPNSLNALPTNAKERKATPLYTGLIKYFPDALAAVAQCSLAGQQQHAPDGPLEWIRDKSTDHHDCLTRHLFEAGTIDTDGIRHSAKVAWRALAILQLELEAAKKV